MPVSASLTTTQFLPFQALILTIHLITTPQLPFVTISVPESVLTLPFPKVCQP